MKFQSFLPSLLATLLLLMIGQPMSAQTPLKPVAAKVLQQTAKYQSAKPLQLLDRAPLQDLRAAGMQDEVTAATLLDFQSDQVKQLLDQREEHIRLQLPVGPGNNMLELWLYRAEILTPDFQLRTSAGNGAVLPYQEGLYYWGIVKGDENSLAAIAISEDEIMGFVSIGADKFVLGRLRERNSRTHVVYKEADLKIQPDFNCGTDDELHYMGKEPTGTPEKNADNCVRMYIEIDNDLVVAQGGVTQATNYVTGAFSQVAILYANEAVNMTVNAIFAWNTADPYSGPGTLDFLNQFQANLNGNFNGDLAHLVGTQGGGGIAYVDVLCNKAYGVGYSAVSLSYSNVPTYSWTVEVLTHEIGHNLGSRHTHACVWNGNNTPIDCCGYNAGYGESSCGNGYSCTIPNPVGGGTIMSYCHLIGGVGINFNNGFGTQPGNLIRDRVYNASCLTNCNASPCNIFTSTNVPVSIPSNQVSTITSVLSIPASGSITDVNVKNLNITHTRINDLIVKVKSPAGTEVTLINQICGGQDNILTNLDDEGSPYSSLPCPPVNNDNYQPLQALSAFDGQNINGTWTLTVQDVLNQDGGSLAAWGLEVCYGNPPAILSAPTVTHPSCGVATGTIVVNASPAAAVEYSINGGVSYQSSATFSGLAPGNYNIVVRLISNPAYLITYSGNPVIINPATSAPAVAAPTITQPSCAVSSGTIAVNASGSGAMEYSINGGVSYQSSATFSGLSPGAYNIVVRLASSPSCSTVYSSNPVLINVPQGSVTFNSTNVPVPIPANLATTVTSTLSIPASGSITDIDVKNLNITHTWINDLIIKVKSPAGTEVTLISQICSNQDNILTNLDDEAAPYNSLPCPPVNNGNYKPLQALSAFDGQNVNGTWTLLVQDVFNEDGGSLNAWGLQVCYDDPPAALLAPTVTQPTCSATTGTIIVNASGSALQYSINGGSSYQSSATFSGLAPGSYNIMARLVSNPAYLISYSGNPVAIVAAQPPSLTAPTVTQPTCAVPTGTIVVNATGNGLLEYSINGGSTYQSSATFSNLATGTYNLRVRLQATPSCVGAYLPGVAISPATGCCALALAIGGNPIASGTYQAAEVITSTGVVANGFDVIFKAGNMVDLASDFEVIIGGIFEVVMVGCVP